MLKKIPREIIILFLIALAVRVMFLPGGSLTFGYDQARDAFIARAIGGGDFKILGPPASAPGLYHGVFYYYFLAVPYFFGKNPLLAAYWTAAFNALTIFIVYYSVKLFSKSNKAAFFASAIFAFSFEASQYAVWLSNPTLGVWSVPTIYLGLWAWLKNKNKWGAVLAGVALGLSTQAEIFLLYHLVPILIWLFVERKKVSFKQIVYFAMSFLLTVSSMILVEIKFGFKGIGGLAGLLLTKDAVVQQNGLGDFVVLYLNQLGKVFANNLLPINQGLGGMLGFAFLVYVLIGWVKAGKKGLQWQPFLASFVLAHLSIVSVGGVSTPFLLVGIGTGIACLAGAAIYEIYRTNKAFALGLLVMILLSNMISIIIQNPKGQTIFSIQKEFTLKNQLLAIDYTYENANNQPFSINTVTSPLWVNNVWAYLYDWYGNENYGFVPSWHGRDQVGQLSDNILPNNQNKSGYLIVEPLQGIPNRFYTEALDYENSYSDLIEEKEFGQIIVQKRNYETN